jgi:hypothetical protein
MHETDAYAWAQVTFGHCALGDRRRTRRLVEYAAREAGSGAHSTGRACAGQPAEAEGAYRLMRNDKVNPGDIAEGGAGTAYFGVPSPNPLNRTVVSPGKWARISRRPPSPSITRWRLDNLKSVRFSVCEILA